MTYTQAYATYGEMLHTLVANGDIAPESVALSNITDDVEILHVAGARAAELMRQICPAADEVSP